MTNNELKPNLKVYIKADAANLKELGVWVSQGYIDARREKEFGTVQFQHQFKEDVWIVTHKDGTDGAYLNTELARNSK